MQNEKVFAQGLIFKKKNEKAPDFVKGSLSVKVDEFIEFLKKHESNGWVNIDLKESKPKDNGTTTYYAELNTWKPKKDNTLDIEAPF